MRAAKRPSNEQLRRIQRCWLRALVALVAVGVWLGPDGLGKSRWGLAAFSPLSLLHPSQWWRALSARAYGSRTP